LACWRPNTECRIIDPETGRTWDRTNRRGLDSRPAVMKGYLNNRKATAATIDGDEWLRTGDIGTVDT
jgi:long-subunit acyl-CoA synthetase (AMP-forming)